MSFSANLDNDGSGSFPRTPSSASLVNLTSYFNRASDRETDDWPGLTLLDTVETFFDARIDLFERNLKKQRDRLQFKATTLAKGKIRTNTEELDKELQKFKIKISKRLTNLSGAWHSTKVVRTKDKLSFFFGVMNVMGTSLLFGLAPEWLHVAYTVQALLFIPLRFYTYRKKNWGYFLADLCYFANLLCLLYLWVFPGSVELFTACYCLTHGSLATAVITWRNSLVFHDYDKMVSMFIHIYPPLVLSTVRHFSRGRIPASRFPAVHKLTHMQPMRALVFSSIFYILWQGLYWKFLLVDRREKIASGQRTTSLTWLLNDRRGPIGKMLRGVRPESRERGFMLGQFIYSIVTELPAIFLLYDSAAWTGVFLMFIFAVSVWNGSAFYIEVFGRKFERELMALRQEIAQSSQSQSAASTSSPPTPAPSSPKVVPSENSEDFNDDYGRLHYAQADGDEAITNEMNTSLMLPQIFVTESDSAASSPREQDGQVFSEQEESKDKQNHDSRN